MIHPAKLVRVLITGLCLLLALPSYSQQGQTSTGTDFWIAFMPNYLTPATSIRIFIASATNNKVQVEVYGDSSSTRHFTQTMQPGGIWTLSLPTPALAEERVQEKAEYKAIHVSSDNPVAVYGFSNVSTSTDSYLALPTPTLGTEYYTSCFFDDSYVQLSPSLNQPLAGEFVIIAPYDNTLVTVGPVTADTRSADTGKLSHAKGDVWTVKLMRGQTYLVQSTGVNIGIADLTGTRIVSSKPVGLLSGHQRCRIPVDGIGNSKDHIMEMIPPASAWGKEYYVMPQSGRPASGDYVRIIAGEDNIIINENGQTVGQLEHAGDFMDRELVLDPVVYKSNGKKFLVVDHSYSQGYNGDPSANADPFSIVMTPREQFQTSMLFRVPNNVAAGTQYENYVTFICRHDSVGHIIINGKRITAYQFIGMCDSFPGTTPAMAAYRIKLPSNTATYAVTSGAPFACYLYGFSYAEAYGHPAGMGVRMLSTDKMPPIAHVTDSACGVYHVRLSEPRTDDSRIADIAMISEAGDLRWDKPSSNYSFTPDPTFVPGDSAIAFTLSVVDMTHDAYAAIYATDRAGNDTVYEYHSYAPNITFSPQAPFDFGGVLVDRDSCRVVAVKNAGTTTLSMDSIKLGNPSKGGYFTVSPTASRLLAPNDSLLLTVCFNPSDTVAAAAVTTDTVWIVVGSCVSFAMPLKGVGATPLIFADDQNFGNVAVGDTECKLLLIRNPGKAPLRLTNQDLVHDPDFSFRDSLPITIGPSEEKTLTYCFHPHSAGPFAHRVTFFNQNPEQFRHSIKDTALLSGVGVTSSAVEANLTFASGTEVIPNPFQNSTRIRYTLSRPGRTTIRLFDITGREVRSFASEVMQTPGIHEWQLDLNTLPNGVYVVALYFEDASGHTLPSASLLVSKE